MTRPRLVIPFRDIDLTALPEVGGKNASLGELIGALASAGVRVPDGFAITAEAFRRHIAQDGADRAIYEALDRSAQRRRGPGSNRVHRVELDRRPPDGAAAPRAARTRSRHADPGAHRRLVDA